MSPAAQAALESWSLPVPLTLGLVVVGFLYLRGWLRYRNASPNTIPAWQFAVFLTGLFFFWIAEGSPLLAIDDDLLTIHMVQHILLMGVAPPLILLGAPALPMLYGLPRRFVRNVLRPLFRWPLLRGLGRTLTHPAFAWLAFAFALIGWHLPAAFEMALRSSLWHDVEHACFFWTGILFWWPVIQPWPSVARWPRWRIPLYLFFATLPCDTLSAFLTFCGRVVYPYYLSAPRPFSLSPLLDQQFAGALMWVCATFIYLIPAVIITVQLLSAPTAQFARRGQAAAQRAPALERRSEAEVF
ncbi:MAG TPA: cytochrome c oxidase assembly protein [Terriglobales bacterium]|nr:cytochrome c oxidase assembly protein [Terriglobales bacterium]